MSDTTDDSADLAPIGHNSGQTVIEAASLALSPEQWFEWLTHVFEAPAARKAELLASFQRFADGYDLRASTTGAAPIGIEKWDDDVVGRAGDLRDKLQAVVKQADNLHAIEKAPVLAAARAIDGFRANFVLDLSRAVTTIRDRLTIYLKWVEAERRREAEAEAAERRREAERLAAEAAATLDADKLDQAAEAFGQAAEAQAVAQAPAADRTRTYGAMGSVTSLRTTWKFFQEESDLMGLVKAVAEGKAPVDYLTFNTTRINFAVKSEKVRAVPGLAIRQDMKA